MSSDENPHAETIAEVKRIMLLGGRRYGKASAVAQALSEIDFEGVEIRAVTVDEAETLAAIEANLDKTATTGKHCNRPRNDHPRRFRK